MIQMKKNLFKLKAMRAATKNAIVNFTGDDVTELRAMVKRFAKKEQEILRDIINKSI